MHPQARGTRTARPSLARRGVLDFALGLAGVALIAFAGVGALGVNQVANTDASPASRASSQAAPASAPDSTFTERRDRALSRDAERASLPDAAADDVSRLADQRDALIARQQELSQRRAQELEANRWVLPMNGYRLTGRFGNVSSLWSSAHTGLDFAAPTGTPIRSIATGTVTEAGYAGAYGNQTIVRLADGTDLWYCHQDSISVSVGDRVAAGQQVGTVGSTGNVTGPHLHLEVRPGGGRPIDPFEALRAQGLTP